MILCHGVLGHFTQWKDLCSPLHFLLYLSLVGLSLPPQKSPVLGLTLVYKKSEPEYLLGM